MKTIRQAAVYIRVSTEEQALEGQSADAQAEILSQYCRSAGISLYKTYSDLGISGKKAADRPGLQALLADSSRALFDLVLVWKISRLSRSLKDLLNIIDLLEKNGVAFSSFSEKFDTSSAVGRMTLQLLGSIAEFERNTIVENVKLGLREYARKGGKTGAVLGYDNLGKGLSVNEKEAALVRHVYDLYVHRQMSFTAIAYYLNKLGFRTKRGCLFCSSSVSFVLGNPVYIGYNRHQRSHTDSYCVPGGHPPVIDLETWNLAQSMKGDRSAGIKKRHTAAPLLAGLLHCAFCGKEMKVFHTCAKDRSYRYYRCKAKLEGGTCASSYVPAAQAERSSVQILQQVLQNQQVIKDVLSMLNSCAGPCSQRENELDLLKAQLGKKQKSLQRYFYLFENSDDPETGPAMNRVLALQKEIQELEDRKKRLAEKKLSYVFTESDYQSAVKGLLDGRQPQAVHQLLQLLLVKLDVRNGSAVFHTRFSTDRLV